MVEVLTQLGMQVDPELLGRALTHRSFAYEQGGLPTNERLEFLGDSVLGLVVTEHLFTSYPDLSEGQLAKLRAAVVSAKAAGSFAGKGAANSAAGRAASHMGQKAMQRGEAYGELGTAGSRHLAQRIAERSAKY